MIVIPIVAGEVSLEEVERRKSAILAGVESGQISLIDGVMSPISKAIAEKLETTEFDMNSWWVETPQNWICPACGRGKLEIARVNTKGEAMCWLVEHHDHMQNELKKRFQELSVQRDVVVANDHAEAFAKRSAKMISAYENTLICIDCNNADAEAKKAARAPAAFSFSPNELRRIVVPRANEMVGINQDVAKLIWEELKPTFELRMKIANRIADIAASNEHWFQVGDRASNPSVVHNRAWNYGAWGVMDILKGPKKAKTTRLLDAWRRASHTPPRPGPTSTEIDHAGQVGSPKQWHAIETSWQCPGCGRNKRSIVRKNKSGEWTFSVAQRYFYDKGAPRNRAQHQTCLDCAKVAEDIGKEAAGRLGERISSFSSYVELREVTKCIIARPHTRHNINNPVVDAMIDHIEGRILDRTINEIDVLTNDGFEPEAIGS